MQKECLITSNILPGENFLNLGRLKVNIQSDLNSVFFLCYSR